MNNYYNNAKRYEVFDDGKLIGRAGDRLAAHHPWGDHIGTLNYDGRVWSCSSRSQGVRLVTLQEFSGGKQVSNVGYVGNLQRQDVLNNYVTLQGNGYSVFFKNCEHIDNYVRGLGYVSPQLKRAGLVLGAVLLIAATRK